MSVIRGIVLAFALLAGVSSHAHAQSFEGLKILAPAAPGGGYDRTARALQTVLAETGLARNVTVNNVVGAGGGVGIAQFVTGQKGDGRALMIGGFGMVASFLTNKAAVTLKDVTPIARLTGEYSLVVVPAASKLKTLADLLAAMKADPGAVSIAGGSAGGNDHSSPACWRRPSASTAPGSTTSRSRAAATRWPP